MSSTLFESLRLVFDSYAMNIPFARLSQEPLYSLQPSITSAYPLEGTPWESKNGKPFARLSQVSSLYATWQQRQPIRLSEPLGKVRTGSRSQDFRTCPAIKSSTTSAYPLERTHWESKNGKTLKHTRLQLVLQ